MEVSRDKKNTAVCFNVSRLFFHTFSKPVQTPVIMCDEIFHPLAVEGDILLPKSFLCLCFDGVIRRKSPVLVTLFQFAKHVKVQGGQVGGVGWRLRSSHDLV
jgi:hypothetical protein